jgi:hypothetical protein
MKREELLERGLNEAIVFDNPEYDEAIIGFDINSCRVIYDYNKMGDYRVRKEGISEEDAVSLIVSGFCKEVMQHLPMEFAIEAAKLLNISLEGSVG